MEDNYIKAYKEVHEILKKLPKEEIEKIPKEIRSTIENFMDNNHNYQFQEDLDFKEQPILEETKALLAVLYRDYWATDLEKQKIIEMQNNDIQKEEEIKKKLYNYENLFQKQKNILSHDEDKKIATYKESWYSKFINFIKQIKSR